MSEIRNAVITHTMLGVEDHGILTCWLTLDYGGSGQGFGGYALDGEAKAPIDWCAKFIRSILETVGVEKWEDLKGKHLRADCDHGKVYRIGNIIKDQWFDTQKLAKECGL